MAAPDMIFWADSFGWLPLHYACANGASLEVVKVLLDAVSVGSHETLESFFILRCHYDLSFHSTQFVRVLFCSIRMVD